MVHPGTYYEHDIDFLGKAITVMGTDPEDSAIVASTIVDADSLGSVFIFQSSEDSMSALAGLTITGGYATDGGGIYCFGSSPTVTNCTVSGNSAYQGGGGMRNHYYSNPTVTNCVLSGNGADYYGGGISNTDYSSPTVTNCTLSGNTSYYGGGMYNDYQSHPAVTNCTFGGNSAVYNGGGMYNDWNSDPTVTNCILWANTGGAIYNNSSTPVVTYSDVEGGYPGEGNINADPLFVDPDSSDYHVDICSPVINAGDPDYTPDPGETDMDGMDRVMNGRVDMGADEVFVVDRNENGIHDNCEGILIFEPQSFDSTLNIELGDFIR
jgi:hypothetical protein